MFVFTSERELVLAVIPVTRRADQQRTISTSTFLFLVVVQAYNAKRIHSHLVAYSDANLTTWAGAGFTFPRNSAYDGC